MTSWRRSRSERCRHARTSSGSTPTTLPTSPWHAGGRGPRCRADAWVSIAGRPKTRLMDPEADLASRPLSLRPADDIEPSPL